jgi:ligand-binding sensor domain-containing protein
MTKNFTRKILSIIICLLCFFESYAQSYVYKHYGVEEGLPSSEVYSAFQDSKGYMWFATDAGVSRFNGYEFKNFDVNDGLTDNTVFLITEDYKGRIWFGTFNCKLSYYENDSIYPYQYNEKLSKELYGNSGVQSFYVDKQENVWLGFYVEGLYKCDKMGKITQTITKREGFDRFYKLLKIDNTSVWGSRINDIGDKRRKDKGDISKVVGDFFLNGKNERIELEKTNRISWNSMGIAYYKEGALLMLNDEITLIKEDKRLQKINREAAKFLSASRFFSVAVYNEYIWYCVENQGVYKCKVEDETLVIVDHFLEGKSVARIFKDNREGFWFQTLKEGVYYLSPKKVKYNEYNNKITAFEIDTLSGQKYLAFVNGDVALFKQNSGVVEKIITNQKLHSRTLKYDYKNDRLLMGGTNGAYSYYNNGNISYLNNVRNMQAKAFLIDDSLMYRVDGFGLSVIKNDKEMFNSFWLGMPKIWCTSLAKMENSIWLGTKDGLRVYNEKKIENPNQENNYLSDHITSMEWLNEDLLLIGTKSYGVLVVKNKEVIDVINMKDGLITNLVRDIHIDNQKAVWVGTNKGMSKINYNDIDNFSIYNLTKEQGLVSAEIIEIKSYKNTIYAATPKGLISFDKTKILANTTPPTISITDVEVNMIKINSHQQLEFSYDQNLIRFHFEGINYTNLGDIEYQYRMLGVDSNWITTHTVSVQYQTLQPGLYTFEVKAKNEDGFWSLPVSYSFTINPPYWKTWWFRTIIILLWVGLIYSSFKANVLAYNKHVQQKIVDRILKKLGKQSYLLIEMDKQNIRVKENNILFVEAFKNYVEVNVTGKKYLYRSTMANMEKKLSNINFVRTHRSFIVQKDKIDAIAEDHLKIQDHQIPIGKTYQIKLKELKNQFNRLNS